MTITIPSTSKAYFIMVNHPEMADKAIKQGFENLILVQGELDEDDLDAIMKTRKVVALYYFVNHEEEETLAKKNHLLMEEAGITNIATNAFDVLFQESDDVESLEDCVRQFPTVDEFEGYLSGKSLILSMDYENRCGNCHAYLRPGDKYCRKCGTERGKGKFEPYDNSPYGVYGPQIKMKYKCNECGYIWITNDLGGDYSEYCPQCGKKKITLQQEDTCDTLFGYVGELDPFDEADRPALLSEEQILALVQNKKEDVSIADADLIKIMDLSGIPVPDSIREDRFEPLTEVEGDRWSLVSRIQMMAGSNPKGFKGVKCPNCQSECIAAIGHGVWNPGFKGELGECICVEGGTKDAMIYKFGSNWQYGVDKPGDKFSAYMCLSCGIRFGQFDIPKSWERNMKLKNAAKGAKEVAKNVGYAAVGIGVVAGEKAKKAGGDIASTARNIKERAETERERWYGISSVNDKNNGWGEESELILRKAEELSINVAFMKVQGDRLIYAYCTEAEMNALASELGEEQYDHHELDKSQIALLKASGISTPKKRAKRKNSSNDEDKMDAKKRDTLDEQLKKAVSDYNAIYTQMSDHGTSLFNQRERSIDSMKNIENLVNSIANHPKSFDADIEEIVTMRENFKTVCDYAKEELDSVQKSALSAGAGIAGGAAVASLAPGAAMWVATTFGTASTGTAISTLSGAAATKAALAWLGGGALSAGGGGIAAGNALLALAGPVGWGIAGATLLASIALFANKKIKLDKQKKEEIEAVLKNTESLKEVDAKIKTLLDQTEALRERVNDQYGKCLDSYGKDFMTISEADQIRLGTLVNETKALAALLEKGV